jgi:glycosidase
LHLFCKQQPDLNWELPEVREAIYENAVRYWLDKGIDGFRIDTVNMYSKNLSFPSVPAIENNQPWQRADLLWSNGPRLHEFLKEMNEKCFSKYDCMTVGECPNTPNFDDVLPFVSSQANMLDMVFQFEIAIIDHGLDYRHMARKWQLSEFKHYLNQFQASIHGTDGWTTNYLENHDQARSVSRFGSDAPEFRVVSGKMLCIYLMTLTGTTFVYQGEEIGSINAPISYPIEDYRDCDTIGFWADLRKASNDDPEILELGRRGAQLNARDQGRMPMQWDSSEQGGFTTAPEAWQKVNPYYKEINVAAQENDPESVLSFYKKMIQFRREHCDLLVYGTFELLDMDNEQTITYLKGDGDKQAVVTLNFTKEKQPFTMPKGVKGEAKLALSNVAGSSMEQLEPFEGRIYFVNC